MVRSEHLTGCIFCWSSGNGNATEVVIQYSLALISVHILKTAIHMCVYIITLLYTCNYSCNELLGKSYGCVVLCILCTPELTCYHD